MTDVIVLLLAHNGVTVGIAANFTAQTQTFVHADASQPLSGAIVEQCVPAAHAANNRQFSLVYVFHLAKCTKYECKLRLGTNPRRSEWTFEMLVSFKDAEQMCALAVAVRRRPLQKTIQLYVQFEESHRNHTTTG